MAETPALPESTDEPKSKKRDKRSTAAIKRQITDKINLSSKTQAKAVQHAKSLLFGLASGAIVLAIVLFGLFNEMVIAPFIRPSSQASATPIILSTDGVVLWLVAVVGLEIFIDRLNRSPVTVRQNIPRVFLGVLLMIIVVGK